jgi:gluconokinase
MLDKIRLHAAGLLPPEYVANLGNSQPRVFDGRCCEFLGIDYGELRSRVLQGGSDEELLAWCQEKGTPRSDFECELFNAYLSKRGYRDEVTERLRQRVVEYGLQAYRVETFFDLFDADEGRGVYLDSQKSSAEGRSLE